MTARQVETRLRAFVAQYASQAAAARVIGVSAPYLSDILQGYRQPGPKVLKALGLKGRRITRMQYEEVREEGR